MWEQSVKRHKSTAQTGSSSKGDSEEEGEQEQQVERLIRETADPLPSGGSWQNEVQQQQQQQKQQEQQEQGAVEFCCKHCNKVMSGKNEDRIKAHFTNASVCTFLDSTVAAECTAEGGCLWGEGMGASFKLTPLKSLVLCLQLCFKAVLK